MSTDLTDVTELARRRQNRWWIWLFGLYVGFMALGILVGNLVIGGGALDGEFLWFVLLMTGVAVLIMGLAVGFLIWRRKNGARWAQPPLLLGVEPRRRKRIVQKVRAGEAVDEGDREIAADVAYRLSGQGRVLYTTPVLVVSWILLLAFRGFDALTGFMLFGMAVAAVGMLFALRDIRRGRVWLAKYADPAASSGTTSGREVGVGDH